MKLQSLLVAGAAALALTPFAASASLVYDSQAYVDAQGFGNAPRHLSLQGGRPYESGSLGWDGSSIVFGSAIPDSQVHDGNGWTNSSSSGSFVMPMADNHKYGVPTTGSLGITSASQIGVLFNATEPAGNSIDLLDLTLKFYTDAGTFLGAIDGSYNFPSTVPGNGSAGFTFVISADEQGAVNTWLAQGGATTRMALEATMGNYAGGPESFTIYNTNPIPAVPEPETYALMMLGLAAVGVVSRRRRNAR